MISIKLTLFTEEEGQKIRNFAAEYFQVVKSHAKSYHQIFLSAMFLSFPCAYFTAEGESVPTESPVAAVKAADEVVSLYHSMQLEGVVNWRAFKQAVTGYNRIKNRKRDVLTLIDFSKPSTEKRLYVFDMKHRRMLYSSVVSHGKNSGGNYATSFPMNTALTRVHWAFT